MWPILLDMTKEESMQHLRCLEIDAFSTLVDALRAQGGLDNEKLKILRDTGTILHISQERHKAEIRRVVNDERLNTIAYHVNGEKHCADEWAEEGQRLIPLMARVAPQTAYSAIADEVADTASKINKQLPSPASTERKRPASMSPTTNNVASTSEQQCNKNLQYRGVMSEPSDTKKRKLNSINLENSNLAQHLMGPPKISKIQQIYRQKTKVKQREQQIIKLKQQEQDKPDFIHVHSLAPKPPPSPTNQTPQKIQPKPQLNQVSQINQKVNILQNVSIANTLQNSVDEIKAEPEAEETKELIPLSQPGCSSDNQPTTKVISKVLTNVAAINKVNQLTITSDLQKTIKVCASRKPLTTKTVTTSSGQKLIVVSNPQSSILQRTLTTIPFKNIAVKNFDKFKIVPATTSGMITTTSTMNSQNSKPKVVTVRAASGNKKVLPFSQVQVLNTRSGIKVLPLGGKIISKTNPVYLVNTSGGEAVTKSIASVSPLMSVKQQDVTSESEKASQEFSTNVPSVVSDLVVETKVEVIDGSEGTTEGEIDIKKEVDLLSEPTHDENLVPKEDEEMVAEEECVVKVEADSNSFYMTEGEEPPSSEILVDGLQTPKNEPVDTPNVPTNSIADQYSENEQEKSVLESHISETADHEELLLESAAN